MSEALEKLLNAKTKSDAEKAAKALNLMSKDFANLILACDLNTQPYSHELQRYEWAPKFDVPSLMDTMTSTAGF
jgi:hypothetical protein